MEDGRDTYIVVAVLLEIAIGQLTERANSCNILDDITALTIAHGYILDTLLSGEECLDDSHSTGDTGRNKRTGQRAKWLAVNAHASLLVHADEAVRVLPVHDSLLEGEVLRVRDIVRDTATLIRGEATSDRDLRQETRVRRTVAHLHRVFECRGDRTADLRTVVDDREAVQHRSSRLLTLDDTVLSLVVAVETCVAIDRRGEQVCPTLLF